MMGVGRIWDVQDPSPMSIPLMVVWRVTVCSWTERETRSDHNPVLGNGRRVTNGMVVKVVRGGGGGGLLVFQKQLTNLGKGSGPLKSPCVSINY